MYELKHTRQRSNPLEGTVRARGHRIVGPLGSKKHEKRHYTTLIIAAVVAAVAAGASTYMASEAAAEQNREQSRMAKRQAEVAQWQKEVEEQQAESARKQTRLKAQRMLNSQAAKAGAAGVVAGEGSLLVNQLDAASLAQYEEDLAAYGHKLNAQGAEITSESHTFESRLFKARASNIEANMPLNVGLSAAAAGASSYASSYKGSSGSTVATQKSSPSWDTGV
jgi:hypothetical protein